MYRFFSDGAKLINLKIRTPDMAPPYGPGGIATLASLAGGEASRPSYRVRGDGHPRPAWGMNLDGYATLSVRAGGRGIPTSLGSLPPLHSGSIPRGDPFSQGGPRWPRWLPPPINYLPIVPLHPFMEGGLNLMKQHRFR